MLYKTNFLVLENMQKYQQEVCPPTDIQLNKQFYENLNRKGNLFFSQFPLV